MANRHTDKIGWCRGHGNSLAYCIGIHNVHIGGQNGLRHQADPTSGFCSPHSHGFRQAPLKEYFNGIIYSYVITMYGT
jgi:hypothetical protein